MRKTKVLFALFGALLLSSSLLGCGGNSVPPKDNDDDHGGDPIPVGEGHGTEASPYSASQACAVAKQLASDETTSMSYFVKGKIVAGSVDTSSVSSYGNVCFSISDDGKSSNKFVCWQVCYLDKAKFTTTTASSLKDGDTIVMFTKIVNYHGNTPDTTSKGRAYVTRTITKNHQQFLNKDSQLLIQVRLK